MATLEQHMRFSRMVEAGQLSAEEAARQMDALGEEDQHAAPRPQPSATARGKSLRVRVSDLRTGQHRANVNVPLGLMQFGLKMAARFVLLEVEGLDAEQALAALKAGGPAKLVDVEDEEKGERVEVFVE